MASEILAIPEEDLALVIRIIRSGVKQECLERHRAGKALKAWCDEEEAYLERLKGES